MMSGSPELASDFRRLTGKKRTRFAAQHFLDRIRSDDLALVGENIVVALDFVEIIKIIDHDCRRFPQTLVRFVTKPIDSLQSRSIAEVKAGDRIERTVAGVLGFKKIMCCERFEGLAQIFCFLRRVDPVWRLKNIEKLGIPDARRADRCPWSANL